MSTEQPIVIHDTCILLDLVELNLLDAFFQLGFRVYTTQSVVSEITNENQLKKIKCHIESGALSIDEAGTLEAISVILDANNGLTFADCSVYELGIRKHGIILSSDGGLRKSCEKAGMAVHGMLWIIERLCTKQIIDCEYACHCLQSYSDINPRSPKSEISNLIALIKLNVNI